MKQRRPLLALILLTTLVLAGCTGGDDGGGGEERLATCPEPEDELRMRIVVDHAHPEPGEQLHLSIYLENDGDEAVDVPANITVEVAKESTLELVMEFPDVGPRFDANDTVEPGDSEFYRRVGDEFPAGGSPGDYVACGSGDGFHGIKPFRVYPEGSGT